MALCFPDAPGIAYRDGRLDYDKRVGRIPYHLVNDAFYQGCIKAIILAVIIGGYGYNNKIRITIRLLNVQCSGEIKRLLSQVAFHYTM